jgi:hypothetical protein
MMPFAHSRHHDLERARDRLCYCKRELDRFLENADLGDECQARTARKLRDEVARAQVDCSWAEHRLSHALKADEATRAMWRGWTSNRATFDDQYRTLGLNCCVLTPSASNRSISPYRLT